MMDSMSGATGSSAVQELYRLCSLSTSNFHTESTAQEIISIVCSSLESRQLQVPDSELPRFIRKLGVIEDRVDSPLLNPLIRKTILSKLERIQEIISGKKLHQEVGLVNSRESFVLNLW